jgi:hypothetical protein
VQRCSPDPMPGVPRFSSRPFFISEGTTTTHRQPRSGILTILWERVVINAPRLALDQDESAPRVRARHAHGSMRQVALARAALALSSASRMNTSSTARACLAAATRSFDTRSAHELRRGTAPVFPDDLVEECLVGYVGGARRSPGGAAATCFRSPRTRE